MNRTRAATAGLLVPATMALGMSADTSYRFLGGYLGITNGLERGLLCGVAEAAILALSVYSWATRTKGAAWLAYGIVLAQAVPAFSVSKAAGGSVRVVLGPVLLALMLHLLLGLEVRMSGTRAEGVFRSAVREFRERFAAYLGIGRRGEDSAAIARSRASDRAVVLAGQLDAAKPGTRRYRRCTGRLASAMDEAQRGLDWESADEAEQEIVTRIVRRKSVAQLAGIEERYEWTTGVPQVTRELELVGNTGGTVTGTRAEHIRNLVASGVTETGTIRNTLAQRGIKVPSDRYIRRVVNEEVPA